jgi:hypothetical protein
MRRTVKLFALFALLAAPAACSGPAAPTAVPDAAARLDGGGTGVEECNRQNGSGNLDCP